MVGWPSTCQACSGEYVSAACHKPSPVRARGSRSQRAWKPVWESASSRGASRVDAALMIISRPPLFISYQVPAASRIGAGKPAAEVVDEV